MPSVDVAVVYADGGSRGNPGPSAIGVVVADERGTVLLEHKESIGRGTNNEAEYRAIAAGLDLAGRFTRKDVRCVSDSELAVRQLTGRYGLDSPGLQPLFHRVKRLERTFHRVSYESRPRLTGLLRRADELVNEALDEEASANRRV